MYKLDLEKAREPEIELPTFLDHGKGKGIPKKSASALYHKVTEIKILQY